MRLARLAPVVASVFVTVAALGHARDACAQTEAQAAAALEGRAGDSGSATRDHAPADEAPPPRPRKKGVVLESSLGALGFVGKFRNVAPPGAWLGANLGYELSRWLYVFGYGELTLTSTSAINTPTKVRAFPIYGFGGGARLTVHATERVALFAQGQAGLLKADVPENALQNLGFMSAERLRPAFGARVGVEWYQANPHLALALHGGARLATGFAADAGSDTPLAWEGALAIRYTF